MEKLLNIKAHQPYTFIFCLNEDSVSDIYDKLIRLTARITEQHTYNIIYIANELNDAIEKRATRASLLRFDEYGVDRFDITDVWNADIHVLLNGNSSTTLKMPKSLLGMNQPPKYTECWLLETYNDEERDSQLTNLMRVELSIVAGSESTDA